MNQLIKSMLSIGAGFSPNDGSGLVVDCFTISAYVFSITLHISLLEIGRESVHVLIIRENGFGFGSVEIVVPNAEHRQHHWHIVF